VTAAKQAAERVAARRGAGGGLSSSNGAESPSGKLLDAQAGTDG